MGQAIRRSAMPDFHYPATRDLYRVLKLTFDRSADRKQRRPFGWAVWEGPCWTHEIRLEELSDIYGPSVVVSRRRNSPPPGNLYSWMSRYGVFWDSILGLLHARGSNLNQALAKQVLFQMLVLGKFDETKTDDFLERVDVLPVDNLSFMLHQYD